MSAHALLVEPFETLAFMRAALVACLALALANGAVGTLLVLRRMSLDGDVLGHAVMPGAAIGFLYAGPSPTWLSLGGLASGLAVAALAGLITGERARHDAGLVAFYLVALSLGVVLVAWRGSNVDVMRVLFGTVLAIDQQRAAADRGGEQRDRAGDRSAVSAAGGRRVRSRVSSCGGCARAVRGGVRGAGGAGAGRELPGLRHAAGGGTDAAAGGGGAVLGAWAWRRRSRWRPASGSRHRSRDCWSPITAICPPVRRSCWREDCCSALRSSPPAVLRRLAPMIGWDA